MKVAITGSNGFLGNALKKHLVGLGDEVLGVRRQGRGFGGVEELAGQLAGAEAVVHLAGAGVADRRWSAAYKNEILNSRVEGTHRVAQAAVAAGLKAFLCGSAVGIYGARGPEAVDEAAGQGDDFLAKVCRAWEAAAQPAKSAGLRVAYLRTGMVLSGQGGALKKMLLPFKLGLGGILGNGRQYYSWVTLEDWLRAVEHLLRNPQSQGAYNLAAPGACDNRTFTRALGQALGRPTVLPMPAFAARLAFGEMAEALLTGGQNARPARLLEEGFHFNCQDIQGAFKAAFAKGARR